MEKKNISLNENIKRWENINYFFHMNTLKEEKKCLFTLKKKTFLYMKKKNICLYENIIRREKEEKRIASWHEKHQQRK